MSSSYKWCVWLPDNQQVSGEETYQSFDAALGRLEAAWYEYPKATRFALREEKTEESDEFGPRMIYMHYFKPLGNRLNRWRVAPFQRRDLAFRDLLFFVAVCLFGLAALLFLTGVR